MLTSVVPVNTSHSFKQEFTKRSDLDFNKRSFPGILFYPLAWIMLVLASKLHLTEPVFCWLMALSFFLVSAARFVLSKISEQAYLNRPNTWRYAYIAVLFSHATLWSFLCFMANYNPVFQDIQATVNILTAGLASAAASPLSCKYRVTQGYICIMLLPTNVFLATSESAWPLAIIMLFFLVYLLLVCHHSHKDYVRNFNIEWSLQEKQEELRTFSQTDFLTKTYNRVFFNECIAQQWFLAQRNQSDIALLMIDLDNFKVINDQYGHLFGDECLIHAANIIREIVRRKSDMLVRFGGEEFVVVLPQTDIQAATTIAEHIRSDMCAEPFELDSTTTVLTASIGVCAVCPVGDDYKVLLQQADNALYKAKRGGRNRVEIAELNQRTE